METKTKKIDWRRLISNYATLVALVLLVIIIAINRPNFIKPSNLINIFRQASIIGLMAVGMTFVVLTGGIDLSVGAIFTAAGMFSALTAQNHNLPWIVPVLAGLAVGVVLGFINGIVVAVWRVPAFIATLGMQNLARGIALQITDAKPVPNLSPQFQNIGQESFLNIPIPVWVMAVVLILAFFLLYQCKYGRYIFAVGGSRLAAKISGVKVRTVETSAYVIAGVLAALSGIIMTARVSSGIANAGLGYETDAIAAVVMGGTSLAGGRGRLWGTIVGFLFMTAMSIGLDMIGLSSPIQLMVKGVLIVLAVMVDGLAQADK